MKIGSLVFRIFTLAAFMLALASVAYAQNNQSWVSVGASNANPCTFDQPCATFQGALAKTNPNGTISAKVSGNYGTVNITKSVIIDGAGVGAFISTTAGDAIIVNTANPGDVVILRNLALNGLGTGAKGINHTNGLLFVEKLKIANFVQGYSAVGSDPASPIRSEFTYTNFEGNSTGADIRAYVAAALSNCVVTGTINKGGTPIGVNIQPPVGTATNVKLEFCEISHTNSGLRLVGPDVGGGTLVAWIRSNHFSNNTIGINSTNGAFIATDTLNIFSNNTSDTTGAPTVLPMTKL